jgi:hypothetical protein
MWISKAMFATMNGLIESAQNRNTDMLRREGALHEKVAGLERENSRLRADQDWFKLRLNQVEQERAQLILAASGVRITTPTFVAAQEDPLRALQEMPDFAMVGADAPEDYSQMPAGVGK